MAFRGLFPTHGITESVSGFLTLLSLFTPFSHNNLEKRNVVEWKRKIQTVKELPAQIKMTVNLAISALIVAFLALAMTLVGTRHAH